MAKKPITYDEILSYEEKNQEDIQTNAQIEKKSRLRKNIKSEAHLQKIEK